MYSFARKCFLSTAIGVAALLAGCAGPAPNYSPSIDNVEALKKSGINPTKTGAIQVAPGIPGGNSISMRGSSMVSPVGAHYGDYIAAALRQELELAKLYAADSPAEISGVLLVNNINAGGISTNDGQIEARFVVKVKGQVRFDKVKRIEHKWEGAFAGAVAIPLAANNYPIMVQKLIGTLVADADFINALKK